MKRKNNIRKHKGLAKKELFKEKIYARYALCRKKKLLNLWL
jgi:hypothetical protein